jgi:hypothetical protein
MIESIGADEIAIGQQYRNPAAVSGLEFGIIGNVDDDDIGGSGAQKVRKLCHEFLAE